VNVLHVKNCEHKNPIVELNPNFTLFVNEKCSIIAGSCYNLQPFNTAKVEMSFFKGKLRLFKEQVDLCTKGKKIKEMTQVIVNAFGWNFSCPNLGNNVRSLRRN
jgi:hypothetical protein